jgi:two-component system osmolarity sensor histidine kinase EnvZ
MEQLLNTFLDFARGDALDDPDLVDPVALAAKVVDNAKRAGGQIVLEAPGDVGNVLLRPQAVHRALSNMVSNALRYGNASVLSVALPDRAIRFTVEDDGPGIPADRREDALRPFLRLDPARNQDGGSGVGLGLAITNDIAQRHGGTLHLGDSERLGGLRIDLVLPR